MLEQEFELNSDNVDYFCKKFCSGNKLNIAKIQLDDNAIEILINNLLKGKYPLEYLNISYNRITDKGLSDIARYVSENQILQSLIISGNEFSNIGVIKFFQNLTTKGSCINEMTLGNNKLTDKCVNAIVSFCNKNMSIKKVELQNTCLSSLGVQLIDDSIKKKAKLFRTNSKDESNEIFPSEVKNRGEVSKRILSKLDVLKPLKMLFGFLMHEFQFLKRGKITKDIVIFLLSTLLVISNITTLILMYEQIKLNNKCPT